METNVLSVILILFSFVVNCDDLLLHGSADPLTARLGGAVLLPCFADRPLPLEELVVDWRRTDSGTIVHLFEGGQSRPESQGDAYRDRADFLSQEIPKGNFSLLLDGVRTADAGAYKCVVYTAQERQETRVEIQEVEWLVVTGADEPVYAHAGEDVTLSCSVDTHVNVTELRVEWRKTDDDGDILVLLYADGENRPKPQDGRYSARAEFFTEEIPKGNFSMKLRKVRTEDKGEFRCQVHSDTDSANTTARIAVLGYSSLHWLVLVLCITVTPVVILTGALSVRNLEGKITRSLLSHWSHVAVPQIMVSVAFILWGVTEGSTAEAFTCSAISLLTILMLFNMAPYADKKDENEYTTLSLGSTIFITAVCAGSLIEISAKYSPTPAEKAMFGSILVGIFFLVMLQSLRFVLWMKNSSVKIRVITAGITGIIFLLITVSSIIALSIYLKKDHPDAAWKERLGTFSASLLPFALVLFSFGVFVYRAICSRRTTGEQSLRDSLSNDFLYHARLFNMLFLAVYSQLFALMQNTFILGYFIVVLVCAFGISACIFIRVSGTFYYPAQKIFLGILIMFHLIFSIQYLSLVLENDKGRPVKICEFLFLYILTVASSFRSRHQNSLLAKSHKYVYFSGAFALPLVNSVALAVVLILKADTGKQPLDLRLIVLISGSVFLYSWFGLRMSAYCFAKKTKNAGQGSETRRNQAKWPSGCPT